MQALTAQYKSPEIITQGQNSGGGHGTRIGQEGASVEISRRKHAVHACAQDCTQVNI